MKNLLIFITLILGITVKVNAQEEAYLRLGMTLTEIRKELPNSKLDNKDNFKVITQETEYSRIFYFINNEDICNLQVYQYNLTFLPALLSILNEDISFIQLNSLEYLYNNGKNVRKYKISIDSANEIVSLYVENM
mgnify:CR=1 FL=1